MKSKSRLSLILLLLILSVAPPAYADKSEQKTDQKESVERDLSGLWVVIMSNSLTRKQLTFKLTQKDGRVRGYLVSKDTGEHDLDGRLDKGQKIKLWGKYLERTGKSWTYEFKGRYEGEPGQETIVGECEFFDRRYDFTAERAE